MIEYALLAVVIYVVAVAQTVFGPALAIGPIEPDLFAVATIVWIIHRGGHDAVYIAAGIGMIADLVSPGPVGAGAAAFALAAYVLVWLQSRLPIQGILPRVAITWLAVTAIAISVACAQVLSGQVTDWWPRLPVLCLAVGVYSGAVALPVFLALEPWPRPRRSLLPGR